jgi:hypothetical protein
MRIGLLTTSFPRFEGDVAGTFVLGFASALAARGHSVRVLAPEPRVPQAPPSRRSVETRYVPYVRPRSLATTFYGGGVLDNARDARAWPGLLSFTPALALSATRELNDLSMQMFRVEAIASLVPAVTSVFVANQETLMQGTFEGDLIEASDAASFCASLKAFDKRHAYQHESVRKIELLGHNTIHGLMDMFWPAIAERRDPANLGSERTTPFQAYVYSRISENYRRIFEDATNPMPTRYKECQLLTDMISGMTDKFAIDLLTELRRYER